ncbi:MAG TPA: hypothetical protein VLT88_11670, partial [Desulfosarcina sp.]|nr:hypothetical protein [Desulfosarcina sp.]
VFVHASDFLQKGQGLGFRAVGRGPYRFKVPGRVKIRDQGNPANQFALAGKLLIGLPRPNLLRDKIRHC